MPHDDKAAIGGMILSRTTRSLENLVTILPMGLESKKRILALITLSAIELCILVALQRKVPKMNMDLQKAMKKYAAMMMTNTLGYKLFCCSSKGSLVQIDNQ